MCGHVTDGTNLKEKGTLFEQPPKEISEMLKVLNLENEKKKLITIGLTRITTD